MRTPTADELARMSWWARLRHQRVAAQRPTDDEPAQATYTADERRAANRAYDRWKRGIGPQPDDREMDAYRAYKRALAAGKPPSDRKCLCAHKRSEHPAGRCARHACGCTTFRRPAATPTREATA